jgi:hypothetical protein
MTTLLESVTRFLDSRGWPIEHDGAMVRTLIRTDDQAFICAIVVVESAGQIVVYSIHPSTVEPAQRGAVAEFVNRANAALTVGNLEIDLDSGQVRFRTGLAVGSSSASDEMVERAIVDNVASAVAYFPVVDAVAGGLVPAANAASALRTD